MLDAIRAITPLGGILLPKGSKKVRLGRRKTKKDAEDLRTKFQSEFNKRGSESPMLTSAQIDEYLRAKKALGDVSLDVVVVSYLERAKKPSIGLSEAVDGFMADSKVVSWQK